MQRSWRCVCGGGPTDDWHCVLRTREEANEVGVEGRKGVGREDPASGHLKVRPSKYGCD